MYLSHFLFCRTGFAYPYALKEILAALASDTPEARNRAYYWTFFIFVAQLSIAQANLFQSWHTRRCYERTRGQLFCAMHYKSLKRQEISGRVNRERESNADLGKTVNLMQLVIPRSKFKKYSNFYFLEATLMLWLNDSGIFLQYLLHPCASQ